MRQLFTIHSTKLPGEMALVETSNDWPVRLDTIGQNMLIAVPAFFRVAAGDDARPKTWTEVRAKLRLHGFNITAL